MEDQQTFIRTHKNLSRIARPKKFEDVLGQELPVRVLCNSLASDRIFPTYIFAGQRGSGKTTCARIFAAGLCCQKRQDASWDRKIPFPCNDCDGCGLFLSGAHPDFVEIDGASNSGVDNVRQIQELATYAPVLSTHKIYLIDEAHMLSKAAFNAFLKVLEEPLGHVVFLMATTELSKFPETVRSRALILHFVAHNPDQIKQYLEKTSKKYNLDVDNSVIEVVSKNSGGALRDALNRLEQVWLSSRGLPKEAQLKTAQEILGVVERKDAFLLGQKLLDGDSAKVMASYREKTSDLLAMDLYKALGEFFSSTYRQRIGVLSELTITPEKPNEDIPLDKLKKIIGIWWESELQFIASRSKALFLESLMLKILDCVKNSGGLQATEVNKTEPKSNKKPEYLEQKSKAQETQEVKTPKKPEVLETKTSEGPQAAPSNSNSDWWTNLLESPEISSDNFLKAVLIQSEPTLISKEDPCLYTILTPSDFFKGKLIGKIAEFNQILARINAPGKITEVKVAPNSVKNRKKASKQTDRAGLEQIAELSPTEKPKKLNPGSSIGPKTKLLQDEFLL